MVAFTGLPIILFFVVFPLIAGLIFLLVFGIVLAAKKKKRAGTSAAPDDINR